MDFFKNNPLYRYMEKWRKGSFGPVQAWSYTSSPFWKYKFMGGKRSRDRYLHKWRYGKYLTVYFSVCHCLLYNKGSDMLYFRNPSLSIHFRHFHSLYKTELKTETFWLQKYPHCCCCCCCKSFMKKFNTDFFAPVYPPGMLEKSIASSFLFLLKIVNTKSWMYFERR